MSTFKHKEFDYVLLQKKEDAADLKKLKKLEEDHANLVEQLEKEVEWRKAANISLEREDNFQNKLIELMEMSAQIKGWPGSVLNLKKLEKEKMSTFKHKEYMGADKKLTPEDREELRKMHKHYHDSKKARRVFFLAVFGIAIFAGLILTFFTWWIN